MVGWGIPSCAKTLWQQGSQACMDEAVYASVGPTEPVFANLDKDLRQQAAKQLWLYKGIRGISQRRSEKFAFHFFFTHDFMDVVLVFVFSVCVCPLCVLFPT